MNIVTVLGLLVSSMLIYAAPLIFTSIGGAYSEHAGVVKESFPVHSDKEPQDPDSVTFEIASHSVNEYGGLPNDYLS